MINLKGIAWNHTRGFVSVVATAQRFEELNPGVTITWEKRSLQAFADAPLEKLAEAYDLIVMDHPHTALAAREKILLPLDQYLPEDFLQDQAANSVGASHPSYASAGHQWTLATDAACPIATWRPDLMKARELDVPGTWQDVLALARKGQVGLSLFPVDVLMHTYTFCEALGEAPFRGETSLSSSATLSAALECLREIASFCHARFLEMNPIRTAEFMTQTDEVAYCPLGYGYSNYSRPGYARFPLKAGSPVHFRERPLRTVLGGAGLAVSARTRHIQASVDYARFTAEPAIQKGLYYVAGGQPGHRRAWTDDRVNATCMDFFKDTLPALDNALVRPPYPGYMYFQDRASPIAHECVAGRITPAMAAEKLNSLYRESKNK